MSSPSASPVVTALEDPSTHAGRNPSQLQQQTRVLTHPSLSLAQKATRSLRLASNHAKAEELTNALDIILARHNAELEIFANEYNTKMEYVQKLTSQSSHYKTKRAVTIQNAKLHVKSLEVNAGTHTFHYCAKKKKLTTISKDLGLGERIKVAELRQLIADDPAYQNLTTEEEDKMKQEVLDHREQKKVGARPTNKSAAQDYRSQMTQMNAEVRCH